MSHSSGDMCHRHFTYPIQAREYESVPYLYPSRFTECAPTLGKPTVACSANHLPSQRHRDRYSPSHCQLYRARTRPAAGRLFGVRSAQAEAGVHVARHIQKP